jgi:hypothetical protein
MRMSRSNKSARSSALTRAFSSGSPSERGGVDLRICQTFAASPAAERECIATENPIVAKDPKISQLRDPSRRCIDRRQRLFLLSGIQKRIDLAYPKAAAPRSTVKPVDMIAEAIRDCSKPGGVILDPFSGTGSVLIAAERTKRRAHVIEPDPILIDISIERWQQLTGDRARHESGRPFVRSGNLGLLSGHKPLK